MAQSLGKDKIILVTHKYKYIPNEELFSQVTLYDIGEAQKLLSLGGCGAVHFVLQSFPMVYLDNLSRNFMGYGGKFCRYV